MQQPWVITIDGPAGSGKSTVGGLLAQQLGYVYFDTGVMYRALALVALQQQLDLHNDHALTHLAHTIHINVLAPLQDDGRQYTVLANDTDVTWDIRTPAVDRAVSLPARVAGVRAELVRQQRAIGQRGQMVMVGRDIGTIVMPEAPLKIYLDASLDIRARRRLHEQQQQGRTVALEQVRSDMARRDELDQHVLQPAADALVLNTDRLSPAEAVDWIVAHIQPSHTHPEVRL
jgi:cytidylate kinase